MCFATNLCRALPPPPKTPKGPEVIVSGFSSCADRSVTALQSLPEVGGEPGRRDPQLESLSALHRDRRFMPRKPRNNTEDGALDPSRKRWPSLNSRLFS